MSSTATICSSTTVLSIFVPCWARSFGLPRQGGKGSAFSAWVASPCLAGEKSNKSIRPITAAACRRPQNWVLRRCQQLTGNALNFERAESDALRFEAAEDSRGLPSAPKVGCVILKAAASAQGHNRTMPHNAGASRKQCPEHGQRHQIWFGWHSAQSWAQCPGGCILRRSFAGQ
mgnify:CR=1 FL=1